MSATERTVDESAEHLRDLVARGQQGDRDALEELYLIHFDRIYSYLHVSVGNRHDAEDLTTQTFLKMLEKIGSFRWQSAPFSAWLFRIAHNLAMDHFRARRRWQPEEEVPEPPAHDAEPSAELEAMRTIGRESMLKLIEHLSPEQQQVLTLKFVFNLPNAEVAAILDKTQGAVKSLQHRALVTLQKQIEQSPEARALTCARGAGDRDCRAAELGEDDALPRADACRGDGLGQGACRDGADRRRRLDALAKKVGARKVTPAAVRVVDVPGTGPQLLGNLRQVDALLVVLDGFSGHVRSRRRSRDAEARAARRGSRPRREAARAGREAGEVGRREGAGRGGGDRAVARACRRGAHARRVGRRAFVRARSAHDEAADLDRQRAGGHRSAARIRAGAI